MSLDSTGFIKNGIKGNKVGAFTRNTQIEMFQKWNSFLTVKNGDTRTRCEICLKLTKITEGHELTLFCFVFFIVNFEHNLHLVPFV